MSSPFRRKLHTLATEPYRSAGHFSWHFAKGKLRGDPIFSELLAHGLLHDCDRLIDLGCGQGLLASWLLAARTMHESGIWAGHWPAAPKIGEIWGLELMHSDVINARTALGERAEFTQGDIRTSDFGKADIAIILDVLHYINFDEQEQVLRRIHAALPTGGTFIIRIGNAAGGLPFHFSTWVDKIVLFLREHHSCPLYCRTLKQWITLLQKNGFEVNALPFRQAKSFSNVILIAKALQAQ